eukprot:TRINITY_DN745_c0_g4_i1.p1 TRINITY_DN745_c0_g4~~TRINITY_DN745_c0_g4_i1.p1  ORF type:complete len:344 (+),score=45.99 TRINITY_DN745_c0_g4_i1:73-1104(+)
MDYDETQSKHKRQVSCFLSPWATYDGNMYPPLCARIPFMMRKWNVTVLLVLSVIVSISTVWLYLLALEGSYRLPCPVLVPTASSTIDVVVMTIDREQVYVHDTVRSLMASDFGLQKPHFNFMVGSPTDPQMDRYRKNDSFSVHWMNDMEWHKIEALEVRYKGFYNYWRCLSVPVHPTPIKISISGLPNGVDSYLGRLIIEDDIIAKPDFWARVQQVLNTIWAEKGPDHKFILSLYQSRRFYPASVYGLYLEETAFSRTQAVFYSRTLLPELSDHLISLYNMRDPYDIEIGRYCKEHNIPIYVVTRPPVQHVGKATTGLGLFFHESKTFDYDDDWVCETPSASD